MLEVYKKILTQAGSALHARCLAGTSSSIEFTRFQLGSGSYTGEETDAVLAAMTALKSPKGTWPVTKAEVVNNATCKLTLNASNLEVTQGYYVTEIGVFAKGSDGAEILYSICVADPEHPDWMPAYNSVAPGSLRYYDYISVGNASNITITVGGGGLVSIDEFNVLQDRVTALEESGAAMVGIKRKVAADGTPQSSTVWTRIGQAVGVTVEYARGSEAVQNDLMEMWPYNQIRPCNLKMDGTVLAYLGDADFDWYATEGTAAEDTSVMDEIPTEMYYAHFFRKDSAGQNWEYKIFADSARYPNSVYVKERMKRGDGTYRDHFYFPIFLGSQNGSGHFVSRAGAFPLYSSSVTADRTMVKTNGANWQIIDVWAWEIVTALLDVMSANTNVRTTFGRGFCDSGGTAYAALNTAASTNVITITNANASKMVVGQTICIGTEMWNFSIARNRVITGIAESAGFDDAVDITFDGNPAAITAGTSKVWRCAQKTGSTIGMASPNGTTGANDGMHSVRALWIEDMWGMLHTGVDGLNLKFNQDKMGLEMYACTDPSKYSDAYGDGYELLPAVMPLDASKSNYESSGYIQRLLYFRDYPELQMPDAVGGGSETYEAAYAWRNKNGQRPFFGGLLILGSYVSPRCRSCDLTFGHASALFGSRPLMR